MHLRFLTSFKMKNCSYKGLINSKCGYPDTRIEQFVLFYYTMIKEKGKGDLFIQEVGIQIPIYCGGQNGFDWFFMDFGDSVAAFTEIHGEVESRYG